jgi:hypothetical protein
MNGTFPTVTGSFEGAPLREPRQWCQKRARSPLKSKDPAPWRPPVGGRVKNGSSRGARRLELATEAGLFFRFAKLRFQNANEVLQSLFGQWIDGRGCHPARLVKPPFLSFATLSRHQH